MPTFLSTQDIYRIIQRELPEGVYPDGPASAFFSTADSYATAKVFADAYQNQSGIYDNYFPNHVTDRQPDWEDLILAKQLDSSIDLQERRDKVITKIRSQRRTTPQDMIATVYTVISTSIFVEIVERNNGTAGWLLDVSELDISTVLNEFNNLILSGPDLCTKDAADFGLTEQQFLDYRAEAYTYEVRIYSYTLSAQERTDLDAVLAAAEPARSAHIILDGLDPSDSISGDT